MQGLCEYSSRVRICYLHDYVLRSLDEETVVERCSA